MNFVYLLPVGLANIPLKAFSYMCFMSAKTPVVLIRNTELFCILCTVPLLSQRDYLDIHVFVLYCELIPILWIRREWE